MKKKLRVAVVDGQGGGIGKAIVEKLKAGIPEAEILALGTNSTATGQMIRAGADEGATGENAIVVNMSKVDVVVGVIGIIVANSMLGELTPAMSVAISGSPALKVLLPINRCGIHVVSVSDKAANLSVHINDAVKTVVEYAKELRENDGGC